MNKYFPIIKPKTLIELLNWRAIQQPNLRAYTFLKDGETEEIHMSYGVLERRAKSIAALLQKHKVKGERVLIIYPPGLDYIAAFFGCLYSGAIAVPSYPPRLDRPDQRLRVIIEDSQAKAILTNIQTINSLKHWLTRIPNLKSLRLFETDNLDEGQAKEWRESDLRSDSLAFLQYTSGSTSAPKGVMVSHCNLMSNMALIHKCFEHTSESILVTWLPPYHDMGLIGGILQPLYGGLTAVIMSPVAFLKQPVRWLQAITRYRATHSGGPNSAYELCVRRITSEQRKELDLSTWKVAFNGAEPVRHQTLERFILAFERCGFHREAFYPCYGLAEATLFVSGGLTSAPPVILDILGAALEKNQLIKATPDSNGELTLVSCGRIRGGQKIVITDPDILTKCPPDQVGEIWISSPSITQGYWKNTEETEHTFRAHLKDTGEGPFLRTGDLGFLKDGELFITGRIKDLIIIRGHNYYPQDIELTVEQSHPALQPGSNAAFSIEVDGEEMLVIAQELKRTHRKANVQEIIKAIRQAVAEQNDLVVFAVVLTKPMSIPKTSSGKTQRQLCKKYLLEGDLDAIGVSILERNNTNGSREASEQKKLQKCPPPEFKLSPKSHKGFVPPRTKIEEQIARLFSDVLKIDKVGAHDDFFELGGDSLLAAKLVEQTREDFNIDLFLQGLCFKPTVANLASMIQETQGDKKEKTDEEDHIRSFIQVLSDEEVDSLLNDPLISTVFKTGDSNG